MKAIILAIGLLLLSTNVLAGIIDCPDLGATLAASTADQQRFNALEMEYAAIAGYFTCDVAGTLTIRVYGSVNNGAKATWYPLVQTALTDTSAVAVPYTTFVGVNHFYHPFITKANYGAGAISYTPVLNTPWVKVIITNSAGVAISAAKYWIVYQ